MTRPRLSIRSLRRLLALSSTLLLAACGEVWNDPYPAAESGQNILYTAFTDRPKHLDPVQSYSENEITFTAQIYEAPLQYHYLKRPFELVTATAEAMPLPRFYDASGRELPAAAPAADIAESVYEIRIRPGIRYQPHPALARDDAGNYQYHEGGPGERHGSQEQALLAAPLIVRRPEEQSADEQEVVVARQVALPRVRRGEQSS